MRKALWIVFSLMALCGAVWSADKELDADLMRDIEDLNKSLSSNIALHDGKGSTSDAKELFDRFATVEAHFVERGDAENAVDLSRKTRALAQQIMKQVQANDYTAATDTATDLSRTCKTCHTFYKKE